LSNVLHMHRKAGDPLRIIRKTVPQKPKPAPAAHPVDERTARPGQAHATEKPLEPYRVPVDDGLTEERLREEFERGRLQGIAEAAAAISERDDMERTAAAGRLNALFDSITKDASRFAGDLEREAYRFAVAVAERIVKREITLDESVVMRQMREAIRRIVGVEIITVRVHPEDEVLVRSHRSAMLSSSDSVREILIEGDESIERGGCILESSTGNVDARIGSQLRQIETALFGPQLPSEEEAW
jgi:flagellar assembly protein FliH